MRKLLAALFLLLALPAWADDAAPAVVYAKMPAHPALWTVHGAKGTAYLLGSIHLLPPNVDWHTKEIDDAMAKADVMVFELAFDDTLKEHIQTYIASRGMLPDGQHLRDMLSAEAKGEFDAEVADLPLSPEAVDRMRPWLASLMLEIAAMKKKNYDTASGVETTLKGGGPNARPVIGLETVEQQLSLIAPDDPKVELQAFEASLKTSATENTAGNDQLGPLLDAWMHAKTERLDTLLSRSFKGYPEARKALLDDRNRAWTEKLSHMIDGENKTYFVTVGAAHLVGRNGVPNLLRHKGYKVEGP